MSRPTVSVTTESGVDGTHGTAITVSRDGRQRTWSGSGSSPTASTGEAVQKMLDDPHTAEYVKESH